MVHFDNCEIGLQWQGQTFELVEKDIVSFAKTWDPQPFHADPIAAKTSYYGGITAPSAYLFCITSKLFNQANTYAGIGAIKHEFEIRKPARAGDMLSFILTCIDKIPSKSKPDRGIVKFELTLTTQNNDMVLKQYSTIMLYRAINS
jgi:acyl dehydratase